MVLQLSMASWSIRSGRLPGNRVRAKNSVPGLFDGCRWFDDVCIIRCGNWWRNGNPTGLRRWSNQDHYIGNRPLNRKQVRLRHDHARCRAVDLRNGMSDLVFSRLVNCCDVQTGRQSASAGVGIHCRRKTQQELTRQASVPLRYQPVALPLPICKQQTKNPVTNARHRVKPNQLAFCATFFSYAYEKLTSVDDAKQFRIVLN